MRRMREWLMRLWGSVARRDHDLHEELQAHLDLAAEDAERRGLSSEAARREAAIAGGSRAAAAEAIRDQRRIPWFESLRHDVFYSLRSLRRSPVFTAVALLTLAIGIGANTGIFTIVRNVLLRPLPYSHPDRLVALDTAFAGTAFPLSPAEYFEFRGLNRSFAAVGAYMTKDVNMFAGDRAHRLRAVFADGELFRALELQPAVGRVFTTAESEVNAPWYPGDEPPPADVVVVSYELWQSAFGGADILGRSISVDGRRREVVGVLRPGADVRAHDVDVWLPLGLNPSTRNFRGYHVLAAIGRLHDGVTPDAARAELAALMTNWGERLGLPDNAHVFTTADPQRRHELRLTPLQDAVLGTVGPVIWTLQAAVGLVLLIVCANLANLLLARAEARRREFAIRLAVGASAGRLLRQATVEALLLSMSGGAVGVMLAHAGIQALLRAYPGALPRGAEVAVDRNVILFALAVSIAAALVFALAPLGHARLRQLASALKDGDERSGGSFARHRLRRVLVMTQVALAVVLVVGAALFARTVYNLAHVDAGFDRSRLVTFAIAAPDRNVRVGRVQVYQRVLQTLDQQPGVDTVTATSELPPRQEFTSEATLVAQPPPLLEQPFVNVDFYQSVMSNYFETMGIPIVRGRGFHSSDATATGMVAVVNERLADGLWEGRDPIGQRIKPAWGEWVPWFTVIGVARNVRQQGVDRHPGTEMYFFVDQMARAPAPLGRTPEKVNVILRTTLPPDALFPVIQRAVYEADATVPVGQVRDMDAVFAESIQRPRLLAQLLGAFSATALLLAAIGTYGLLSYMAAQRRREMGVRMALGANRAQILWLVLSHGMGLTAGGVAVGIGAAVAVNRLIESLLFGVRPSDAATLAAVAATISLVALAACSVPAWRATRVNPNEVLRAD